MKKSRLRPIHKLLFLCFVPVAFLVLGCKQKINGVKSADFLTETKFDEEEFADIITAQWLQTPDSLSIMASLYRANDWLPLWLAEDGRSDLAHQLLNELDSIKWDGLIPEHYQHSKLRSLLDSFNTHAKADVAVVVSLDTLLTHQYIRAARHLRFGLIVPKKADSLWHHSNDSVFQLAYLIPMARDNRYPSLDSFKSQIPAYQSLKRALRHYQTLRQDSTFLAAKKSVIKSAGFDRAVRSIFEFEPLALPEISQDSFPETQSLIARYQLYYGLKPTGIRDSTTNAYLKRLPDSIIQSICANMERIRWLPQAFEDSFFLVNIPQMDLRIIGSGVELTQMRVVVGKISRQTPVLNARMTNIVFNPSWGVPPTILKKDVIPGVEQSGVAYLRRKGLKVYDQKGNPVDASIINASNYRRYLFKQPPGDANALGYIKFNLPNRWDIYLHDTPHREDFVKDYRALSSGCIRVQQPKELASFILVDLSNRKRFTLERIDTLISKEKTHWEVLPRKIPVHILYLTAFDWHTGDGFRFAKDIYSRDRKIMAALPAWTAE